MLVFAISLLSCSSDEVKEQIDQDLDGLLQVSEVTTDSHQVELFSPSGELRVGYNPMSLRIKDLATDQYLSPTNVAWKPNMKMTHMEHAAPASALEEDLEHPHLYSGYVVFTMPENEQEKWEVVLTYSLEGTSYSVEIPVEVRPSDHRTVTSFEGSDGSHYIIALVEPFEPEVALNDIEVVLYRMVSMDDYLPAEAYKILLDPRMPGMGNHSSPNNQHLQHYQHGLYKGKLSLTMTGLWRLNLQLESPKGTVIAGEPVSEDHPQSSLYLQFEF